MGEKTLVESQVNDSIELIRELDSSGYSPTLVSWYYYDDADEWRLLLAGKSFDQLLPKQEAAAYRFVAEAISKKELSSLTISEIKIIPSEEALAKTVQFLMRTGEHNITRTQFSNTMINGLFIQEILILRSA